MNFMPFQMSGKPAEQLSGSGCGTIWPLVLCGSVAQPHRGWGAVAAQVVCVVHYSHAEPFSSSALLRRLSNEIVMLAAFFHGPMPSLKKGDFGHVARCTYLWPHFIC